MIQKNRNSKFMARVYEEYNVVSDESRAKSNRCKFNT
jgi:hypothetical protein